MRKSTVKAGQRVHEIVELVLGRTGEGNLRAYLATSTLGVFLLQILSIGLSFGSVVLLARLLGTTGYGIYAYVWSLMLFLTTVVTFGLPQLLIRNISVYRAQERWDLIKGLLHFADRTILIVSFCLSILLSLGIWLFSGHLSFQTLMTFLVALLILPLLGLLRMRRMALQGFGRIIQGEMLEYALAPMMFLTLILGMYFLEQEITPLAAIGMQVAALGVTFSIGEIMLKRQLSIPIRAAVSTLELQEWLHRAFPLLLIMLLQVANRYVDILMLGPIKGAEAVGLYKVAFQVAMLVGLILQAVSVAIGPTIATLHVRGERTRLQRVITQGTRAAFLISLPLALAWVLTGQWFLGWVFGQEFTASAVTLALLTIGQLGNLIAGPAHQVLIMTNQEDKVIKGWALAVGINVSLNTIFIPRWGIEGAAITTLISMMVWNILLTVWIYKELGIYMSILGPSLRRIQRWGGNGISRSRWREC
jgi:O-antigen/teichoic acid export membrane protein